MTVVFAPYCHITILTDNLLIFLTLPDVNKGDVTNINPSSGLTPDLIAFTPASTSQPVERSRSTPTPSASVPSAVPHAVDKTRQQRTVKDWSVDDVCGWLSSLGLSKYSALFKQHDIDGQELLELDKEILEKEIKISRCLLYIMKLTALLCFNYAYN